MGACCSDAPSHLSPPNTLMCAATSCFVTTASKRACQVLLGLLAQLLQNEMCNQRNGLKKKLNCRHLFLFPTSNTVPATAHGSCRTENSHRESAFPWGCLCRCNWGHQGAPGVPVQCSCHYCGLLAEPGSGWDRSGHSAQIGSHSPRCDVYWGSGGGGVETGKCGSPPAPLSSREAT